MRNQDKFRGCLVGGAAGDALGYEIEFKNERVIFSRYGERGITEFALHGGKALISDDTQMTLFTAAGLLLGTAREKTGGAAWQYREAIRDSYLDWLRTQSARSMQPAEEDCSWLMSVPELFSARAPGNTCIMSLEQGGRGTIEKSANHSKGCGGVMRVAPVGLYFNDRNISVEEVARIGAQAAAITHGHILGWMPAAAFAQIIHEISQNSDPVYDAVMKTLYTQDEMWPESKEKEYFLELMNRAVDLASMDGSALEAIHRLGEGWVAEEALAIAVYCALKYPDDYESAIIASVNHKGDSDSTGAIAGNIVGASVGLKGIPEKFIADLELKDVILEMADDLWHDCQDPAEIQKYMKCDISCGGQNF